MINFHVGYVLPPRARSRKVPVVYATAGSEKLELGRFTTDLQSQHACIVLNQVDLLALFRALRLHFGEVATDGDTTETE